MPNSLSQQVELAFQEQISATEVDILHEDEDLHIAGDDWTLVLEGDPATDIMIALDDEDGEPEALLRSAIPEEALASMRDLNEQLQGNLVSLLGKSPDPLANALGGILAG